MANKTEQDLATRVLQKLKVISSTEAPDHEDAELVKSIYRDKLAELKDEGKAYWASNEIPQAAFIGLSKVIAQECATEFGKQYAGGQEGRDALAAHSSKQSDGLSTPIEYF
ncbi:MAG: hypothetical protein COA78_21945 [Blastopirellula sp.]|nr:MAG: hypothetical protein COA78_21945 [Blastopirellula sp.]